MLRDCQARSINAQRAAQFSCNVEQGSVQKAREEKMEWYKVGKVNHYFDRIGVAAMILYDNLAVGDWIADIIL
jgi:hypothetical protein